MADSASGTLRVYPCERCGADLAYTPEARELACAYCGFRVPLEIGEDADVSERDLESTLERVARQRAEGRTRDPEELEVECPSCNAVVAFRGSLTSRTCAYCASPIQRSDVHCASDRIGVDAVLPFAVDQVRAREQVGRWLHAQWLAPESFRSKTAPAAVQALYVPYWTFDALTSSFFRGRTRKEGKRGSRRRTGSFRYAFDDLAVPADRTLGRALTRGLEPWPLAGLRPYEPRLLAGYLAKTYEIGLEEGWKRARERMERELDREAKSRIGGDSPRIDLRKTRWQALTYRHLLLPVFLLSIRHGDAVHRIAVNGATGRVSGRSPLSFAKLALFAGTGLVTVAVCLWALSFFPS